MNIQPKTILVSLGLMLASVLPTRADALTDNAMALVKEATDAIKTVGKEKAFAEINDPKGRFLKGELYIFVVDFDGVTRAHGSTPKLVGMNMKDLKDADGKLFIQSLIEKAKGGGGWVDYKMRNPVTNKVQDKTSYAMGVEGMNLMVGCGFYKTAP